MATVIVEHPVKKNKASKTPIFWYDPDEKKMLRFDADRIDFKFEYNKDKKKYVRRPVAVIDEKKDDQPSVEDWYKKHQRYFTGSSIDMKRDHGIYFEVDDEELDEFIRSANRSKFKTRVL